MLEEVFIFPFDSWAKQVSERWVSLPKLSKLELDSNPGLSSKTVLIPLHPSASPRLGMTDHLVTSCHHWSLRCRASAACLGLLNGKSAVSSHSCYYFLLVWYIYLFLFINNNRKQRCIRIGNKYPSLCEYHKCLHDMKAHILYYLHYVREGIFFGYYGIRCSRNAHRHRLMKRWS